jgi:hypothetical protein
VRGEASTVRKRPTIERALEWRSRDEGQSLFGTLSRAAAVAHPQLLDRFALARRAEDLFLELQELGVAVLGGILPRIETE